MALTRDEIRAVVSNVCISWDHAILNLDPDALLRLTGLAGTTWDQDPCDGSSSSIRSPLDLLRSALPLGDALTLNGKAFRLTIPVAIRPRRRVSIVAAPTDWTRAKASSDPALPRAVARGLQWRQLIEAGEISSMDDLALHAKTDRKSVRQILLLAFLAPDLQQMIFSGRQPPTVQLTALLQTDLPLLWADQRAAFGL